MSLVDRIKTDPVMNAVFNKRQKMIRFDTRKYIGFNPTTSTVRYTGGTTNHYVPARNPTSDADMTHFDDITNFASLPDSRHAIPADGPKIRARQTDITVAYRDNPDLYWINMIPKDLYNINKINTPNPIISSLNKLPVHISSLHRSFS